jgi:hypothetical protein
LKPQFTLSALALLGSMFLMGCPKEEANDTPPPVASAAPTPAPTPEPAPTPKPTTALVPESGVAGVAARVKMEIDGKEPDGGPRGAALAAGKASFAPPAGWKAGKGGAWASVASADGKSSVAAGVYTDTASAKLSEAAGALGYSDCVWAPAESVTVGKDKLAGVAADGTCKQNGAAVKAAYVAYDSMKVLAIGGWADGGDATGVFSTFRHSKGVAGGGGGDSTGLKACCDALAQNANSAPIEQKGSYLQAAAACRGLISNPQGRALLGSVRGMLGAASVPVSCK